MSEPLSLRPLSDSQRQMLMEATNRYELVGPSPVADHLTERGINLATALDFRVGVVEDPFPEHAKFRGSMAIPYLGHDGRVLQMRFRCIQDHDHRELHHGKYMSLKEETPRMYNVRALHTLSPVIAVAEGEMDTILLNQLGIPAVGIAGAQVWFPHHAKMLAGFSKVLVYGDPDEAGAELVGKIVKALFQAEPVRLKAGDVGETFLAEGPEPLLEPYERALRALEGEAA